MTNEQKAKKLAESNLKWYYEEGNSYEECYQSALQAMQWKDEQEIEFLQSLMFHATYYIFDKINERIKFLKGE